MRHYSKERKEAVLAKMMPPQNISVMALAEETGISQQTLYNWRKISAEEGCVVPGNSKNPEKWSSENKFAIVLEIASLNQAELGEYCRKNGLYPEQVELWKQACIDANMNQKQLTKNEREALKKEQKKTKRLEKELLRKERALAETAALLVLQKKAQDLWGVSEDE